MQPANHRIQNFKTTMGIPFYKMDGAGNDFVVVDNRKGLYELPQDEVALMCHRRFGVGADGLMTIESAPEGYDFEMVYYNSDGRVGSMCGNGGRCIAALASHLGMGERLRFLGYDGPHEADIVEWNGGKGVVRLGMRDVEKRTMTRVLDGIFLDTGSPHYVQWVDDLEHYDVVGNGRRIRQMDEVFPMGTNVDFIEMTAGGVLALRTYERGVEDETWACGTGVTAAAVVSGRHSLKARGGDFKVDFSDNGQSFCDVWLTGPVSLNFKGEWE